MEDLFNDWKITTPKYDKRFREPIFDTFSKKGGGSEQAKKSLGKHFSNNYELYMYAFFLGLYNNKYIEIPEDAERVDFSHAIQYWGSKSKMDRKDFTNLQEYMFMALLAKTDFDMVELEKGKVTSSSVVKKLRTTLESYTNGGLILIQELIEDNKGSLFENTFFLKQILAAKEDVNDEISKSEEIELTEKE